MKQSSINKWVIAGVAFYVMLPDFVPILGEFDDAALVAWALNYIRNQGEMKLAKFKKKVGVEKPLPRSRRSEVIDVECRRLR